MIDEHIADAQMLEEKNRFFESAQIYETYKHYEKAAELYARSNQISKSAELYTLSGNFIKAAENYLLLHEFDKAAELYSRAKNFNLAAKVYVRLGNLKRAADLFEKAENWKEAAKVHLALKNMMRAGEFFEKAGEKLQSAEVYETMLEQTEDPGIPESPKLENILQRVKLFEKAAEIFMLSQEIREALLMMLKIGDIEAAANLYSNCFGDISHELLAAVDPADDDLLNNVIHMFEQAKDFQYAAMLCEERGQKLEAAQFYYRGDDFLRAAEMYAQVGQVEQAALMHLKARNYKVAGELFERQNKLEQAAQAFESGRHYFEAGILYNTLGRYDKAVELLQKINADHPRFLKASDLISSIFSKKGMIDLAIQRYRKVVQEIEINAQSIEFYYRLVCILLEKKRFEEAHEYINKILDFNPEYKDTIQLMKQSTEKVSIQKTQKFEISSSSFNMLLESFEKSATPTNISSPALTDSTVIQRMEGFEFLRKISLFEELTLTEMKRIWEICDTTLYEQGKYIFRDDTPGLAFYIIKRGSVTIRKTGDEEEEILTHLLPGEHFGEMSIIDTARTSANVFAEEDVELFVITRENFHKLLELNDRMANKIYRALMKTLCQRLRISTDKVVFLRSCLE